MRFYAARMSNHANKCRQKQGVRRRREGVRRRREGDPEAPAPRIPWRQGTHQVEKEVEKEYVAVEKEIKKEHVAVEKEFQKHPHEWSLEWSALALG